MIRWIEKKFKLREHHTDIRTEFLAGITVFITMAYALATARDDDGYGTAHRRCDTGDGTLYEPALCPGTGTQQCRDCGCYDKRRSRTGKDCRRHCFLEWSAVSRHYIFGSQGGDRKSCPCQFKICGQRWYRYFHCSDRSKGSGYYCGE